jgi:hypothetical protein
VSARGHCDKYGGHVYNIDAVLNAYCQSVSGTPKAEDPLRGVKENTVMNAVDEYLAVKRIPHWRVNSGALNNEKGRLVRFGSTGMSDFYAIGPGGISIWIECKRPKGGRLSEAQREFLDCINRNGGVGIVVRSVEELEQQLKEAGVLK